MLPWKKLIMEKVLMICEKIIKVTKSENLFLTLITGQTRESIVARNTKKLITFPNSLYYLQRSCEGRAHQGNLKQKNIQRIWQGSSGQVQTSRWYFGKHSKNFPLFLDLETTLRRTLDVRQLSRILTEYIQTIYKTLNHE